MKIFNCQIGKITNRIAATFLIILMITMGALIMLPTTTAHSPPWQIPTHAYIWVEPNPIGVGQSVTVYMWLNQLYGAEIAGDTISYAQPSVNNYRFHNYNLTITLPDGNTTTTIFNEISDPTSSQYTKYTPTEVGTYTFTFTFPGQVYGANGDGYSGSLVVNDTYLPSSASQTLTVQQTPIASAISSSPMPTAYWTRPIYGANTNWYTISSNWLGEGPVNSATGAGTISAFLPTITRAIPDTYVQTYPGDAVGPLTSHVMWTYPLEEGGIVGGNNFPTSGVGYFEGSAYEQRFINPIIIYGTIYYTMPVSFSGTPGGLFGTPYGPTVAQSLITGQILWSRTDVPALSFGYIYNVYTANQHGVYPAMLVATSGGRGSVPLAWEVFDAYTGNWLFNATNIPNGLTALGPSGEQLKYVFANAGTPTNPDWTLGEWNSSKLWSGLGFTVNASVPYAPTIMGPNNVVDASLSNPNDVNSRYDWNVSVPWYNSDTVELAALAGNVLLCMNGSYPVGTANMVTGYFSWAPYTYFAVNLNASVAPIGKVLWSNTITPSGNLTVTFGGADPVTNVFVETYRETQQFVGYSLTTGQKLWGPTPLQVSFDYYGSPSAGTITDQLAYGRLYSSGYAGIIYTYDLTNGNLLWTYGNGGPGNSTNAGLNTPYGDYPTFINAVGNGVLYLVTTEHTISDPIWKGALARAINATTGQEIWTLSDFTSEFGHFSYAIADGYATWFNGYDDSVYSVGRGPSATTVSAPSTGIPFGTPLVIKGTVMDISAGTQQQEQKGDFPNGVPVASDASMGDWMSYVYQQQQLPTNFTGVPVTISVLDSNGNYRTIGTATTDTTGSFSLTWTPDIPGNFTVFANFAGTNGYWPSSAENSFTVMQQSALTPTATPPANLATTSDLITYIIGGVVAIIIAIAIVGAVIVLMFKRRP